MAITHATVKAPGQQLFALADWNVSHVIGANTIGNTEISSHLSTKITGFNTGSAIVFYSGLILGSATGAGLIRDTKTTGLYSFCEMTPSAGNRGFCLYLYPSGTSAIVQFAILNSSDQSNNCQLYLYINGAAISWNLSTSGTGTPYTSFTWKLGFPITFDNMISLTNVTMSAAPADHMKIGSTDLSAGNTQLSWYGEGTSVGTGTPAADRTIAVKVNGTQYYLLASTSSS